MSKHVHKLNSAGDTIVEVLLAIAIVSAVLGGAYASVSRSSQGLQQSQERGEALKFLESQVEQLKSLRSVGLEPPKEPFCIAPDARTGQMEYVKAGDDRCLSGIDGRYSSSLRQISGPLEYEATIEWDKVGSTGGQEQIRIVYRMEQ